MNTNYATERVITEIVWSEFSNVGLTRETLENFFVAANSRTRAQGRA